MDRSLAAALTLLARWQSLARSVVRPKPDRRKRTDLLGARLVPAAVQVVFKSAGFQRQVITLSHAAAATPPPHHPDAGQTKNQHPPSCSTGLYLVPVPACRCTTGALRPTPRPPHPGSPKRSNTSTSLALRHRWRPAGRLGGITNDRENTGMPMAQRHALAPPAQLQRWRYSSLAVRRPSPVSTS